MFSFPIVPILWLAAMILLLIIEGCTAGLVSIWFAIGALAGLITSLLTPSIGIQLLVFVLVSVIALILTKPIVAKFRRSTPDAHTNGDRNLGREATIIEAVAPGHPGRARLDGVDWAARSLNGDALAVGTLCRVAAIESTVLVLEPVSVPVNSTPVA